jgi:AraC family transcriptional regulator
MQRGSIHRDHGGVEPDETVKRDRAMSDAYGQQFGERMRAEHVHAISRRGLREPDLAVTEIRCDDPSPPAMSCLLQREDAFLAGLLLRDFPHQEYWEDGK